MAKAGGGGGRSGINAPFSRVGKGEYRSANGLTVKFHKSGSGNYATVYHSKSGRVVWESPRPIKTQRAVLQAAQLAGTYADFNRSVRSFAQLARNRKYSSQFRSAVFGAFRNV